MHKFIFPLAALFIVIAIFSSMAHYISPRDELSKADAIVAISGGNTEARTLAAIELYQQGWAPKLIFSGAALDPLSPSNAEVMRSLAKDNGVPNSDIIIEENAQNTVQNALGSTEILKGLGIEKVILVTSPYHQRRAYLEFKSILSERIEIINYPAQDEDWSRSTWWQTPRGWYLTFSEALKIPITLTRNIL